LKRNAFKSLGILPTNLGFQIFLTNYRGFAQMHLKLSQ